MESYKLEKIQEFAEIEGTELGEALHAILRLQNAHGYVSDEFHEAVERELEKTYKWIKDYVRIFETEETYTIKFKDYEILD